jgi:four helix bundle protein
MAVQHYQQLIAWQKAIDLVTAVYRSTAKFPKDELYGLTSQMRRAAVSIPSNIAEGQGRRSRGEFQHFLGIAKGSLFELETQVLISVRLGFIGNDAGEALQGMIHEVGRILSGFMASLKEQELATSH